MDSLSTANSASGVTEGSGVLNAPGLPDIPAWLRELYPFSTRTLIVGSELMSFVELGSPLAPPVILLHGNPTWSLLWRQLMPRLALRYRVIVPDMIGFGLSTKPDDPRYHTLLQHTDNLAALLEALAAENSAFRAQKSMLVMHDWGGPIGLAYAARNPARIRKLVLVNSWLAPALNPGQVRLKPALRLCLGGALAQWLDARLNLCLSAAVSTTGNHAIAARLVDAYKFPFQNQTRTAMREFFRMTEALDDAEQGSSAGSGRKASNLAAASFDAVGLREGLRTIDAPVEILWGARDPLCGEFAARTLHDSFARSQEPFRLEYHGHMLPEETPEALLTRILEEVKVQPVLRILG